MLCLICNSLYTKVVAIVDRILQEAINNPTCKATEISLLKLQVVMGSYLENITLQFSYLCAKNNDQFVRIYSGITNNVIQKDAVCDLTQALRRFLLETYVCQVDKIVFEHVMEVSIDPIPALSFEEVDQILGQIRQENVRIK
jgi:hypothetical protein